VASFSPAPEESILWLMKHAFVRQRRHIEEAMRANGITATQAGVITQLRVSPGLSSSDIARRLDLTPQAVMAAVSSLEKLSLLERANDPHHGRIRQCFLTDEGEQVADACDIAAGEVQEKLLAPFDDAQRRAFRELLTLYLRER
jgi:DNA-binding MarR family transcriptional regulator